MSKSPNFLFTTQMVPSHKVLLKSVSSGHESSRYFTIAQSWSLEISQRCYTRLGIHVRPLWSWGTRYPPKIDTSPQQKTPPPSPPKKKGKDKEDSDRLSALFGRLSARRAKAAAGGSRCPPRLSGTGPRAACLGSPARFESAEPAESVGAQRAAGLSRVATGWGWEPKFDPDGVVQLEKMKDVGGGSDQKTVHKRMKDVGGSRGP